MPAGRPSKYDPAYCEQARKLCRLGATDLEIADFFGVSVTTLYRWKNDKPEFCEALKEAKAEADARVEESLYHRATGYSHDAEKIFNNSGEIVRAKYREHYPPDTTAMIFWLKNRQPERWRDAQQHDHRFVVNELSDAELADIASGSRDGAASPKRNPSKLN